MEHPFKVHLLPFWFQDVLQAHNKPSETILNYEESKSLFSQEELINLLALQQTSISRIKPFELGVNGTDLQLAWSTTGAQHQLAGMNKQASVHVANPQFAIEMIARFQHDAFNNAEQRKFSVIDMKHGHIGLVLYPELFQQGLQVSQVDLYEIVQVLLTLMYQYRSYQDVAVLPIFKKYLELLNQSQIAA